MSIPPIHATTITTGLAGTERAAAAESGRTPVGERLVRPADAVGQTVAAGRGDATGDHDADGRQSLDTFERRETVDDLDMSDDPEKEPGGETLDFLPGDHLDLQA